MVTCALHFFLCNTFSNHHMFLFIASVFHPPVLFLSSATSFIQQDSGVNMASMNPLLNFGHRKYNKVIEIIQCYYTLMARGESSIYTYSWAMNHLSVSASLVLQPNNSVSLQFIDSNIGRHMVWKDKQSRKGQGGSVFAILSLCQMGISFFFLVLGLQRNKFLIQCLSFRRVDTYTSEQNLQYCIFYELQIVPFSVCIILRKCFFLYL